MIPAVILLVLASLIAFDQVNSAAFDVTSIKLDRHVATPFQFLPEGRFRAVYTWAEFVVEQAYDLKDYQVSGGPAWVASDRFDIEAKAGNAGTNERQMRMTLQTLSPSFFS